MAREADHQGGRPPLACYAVQALSSRGRLYGEPTSRTRSPFQRDRDRIIHSTAFRRLTHKTQVFIFHEGDHYRTRLTHSLEVAQIARSIARQLGLDEDLTEALALAHDLGHSPFGHAGERALDRMMNGFGGFDHNAHSLRIVTRLEQKYAAFDGLNLTWESLEGLVKHNGPLCDLNGVPLGHYAGKSLPEAILDTQQKQDLQLSTFAAAEAQTAALSDDIAYNNHDMDDGLRSGLIHMEEICEMALIDEIITGIHAESPDLPRERLSYELNRRLIAMMIHDVIAESQRRLKESEPHSADHIRQARRATIAFSEPMTKALNELQNFLHASLYRHPKIIKIIEHAELIVCDLFSRYMSEFSDLPEEWHILVSRADPLERPRYICDFVAGMTDRFAINEHRRLFDETPELR